MAINYASTLGRLLLGEQMIADLSMKLRLENELNGAYSDLNYPMIKVLFRSKTRVDGTSHGKQEPGFAPSSELVMLPTGLIALLPTALCAQFIREPIPYPRSIDLDKIRSNFQARHPAMLAKATGGNVS